MKRKNNTKSPDAILCSDIHLREDTPTCRMDDYQKAQWKKVDFIAGLQKQYNCPVFCGGDLFHHWKSSPRLLSVTMDHLPKNFYSVAGQHDLPQHSLDLIDKSGIYTLQRAGKVYFLPECHWGQEPTVGAFIKQKIDVTSIADSLPQYLEVGHNILIWHHMVWQGKKLWPGQTDPSAKATLRKYSQYQLILTGDNHNPFVEEYEGRLLVNPGSMMRMTADQVDHRPRVYLWYAGDNTVEPVYLPIEQGVVSRQHIERQEQRDERIDAFVSRLNEDWNVELDFEKNLRRFAETNQVRQPVMDIVYKSIEK